MKPRRLGKDSPIVSKIGPGCMRMSSFPGAQASRNANDEPESAATIEAALDAGINFLDTGDFYGMGDNEMLVGRAIRSRRDQAFVSAILRSLRPSTAFVLAGRAQPIQEIGRLLKAQGVDGRRLKSRAFLATGKAGLESASHGN